MGNNQLLLVLSSKAYHQNVLSPKANLINLFYIYLFFLIKKSIYLFIIKTTQNSWQQMSQTLLSFVHTSSDLTGRTLASRLASSNLSSAMTTHWPRLSRVALGYKGGRIWPMLDHCDFHVGSFHFACHHDDNHNTIHIVSSHRLFTSSSSPMSYPCDPCGPWCDHQMVHQKQQQVIWWASPRRRNALCVCLIWGWQGVVREARLFGTKGTRTLCAYVPLLPNKGARECENASAVRVQPN